MNALKSIAIVLFCCFVSLSNGQSSVIWNGGITEEERLTAPEEGTKLVFFVASGNYLANIAVTITNEGEQEIIATTTIGPWLIVDLPAGTFQLIAERENGDRQSIKFELNANDVSKIGIMFPGD
ncbi:MAG: hypothetical protein GKR91_13425 [Pseudomonadales bacterium]|nr:hypothetical protein [Pseudomonadales bacterium]